MRSRRKEAGHMIRVQTKDSHGYDHPEEETRILLDDISKTLKQSRIITDLGTRSKGVN